MPDVEILDARVVGDALTVHGTVDGAGYRVVVPKADVDAARTKAAQQKVVAQALVAEWQRERPVKLDLNGRVAI